MNEDILKYEKEKLKKLKSNNPEKYIAEIPPISNDEWPVILNFNETSVFIKPEPAIKKAVLKSNNPIERKISLNFS